PPARRPPTLGDPTGYETSWVREFFYDSPRARFLAVDYEANSSATPARSATAAGRSRYPRHKPNILDETSVPA
ncbi:MAG: hypothetical protein KKI02_07355, partial [Planctomycetes bacterium]|nr:hypothetical protein [Planctomycetota bacterium]